MILARLEDVSLAAALVHTRCNRGRSLTSAEKLRAGFIHGRGAWTVLTKLVIEGVFSETGSMRRAEATGISRDVGITATAIVGINNGLGMNMCKRFSRALLLDHKVAEFFTSNGALHGNETTVVGMDVRVTAETISSVKLSLIRRKASRSHFV